MWDDDDPFDWYDDDDPFGWYDDTWDRMPRCPHCGSNNTEKVGAYDYYCTYCQEGWSEV